VAVRSSSEGPELIPELDALRRRFILARDVASSLVEDLSDEQFNQRPGESQWSVCECFDHLVKTGDLLGHAIDEAIERAHRSGRYSKGPFRYGWFESWFTRNASASPRARRRKVKTFKLYTPRAQRPAAELLSEFRALQTNLVERVEAANGIDLARVKVRSPALRPLRMSLGQWLEMLAGHQERHFEQAREARALVLGG
jgi:hypothetical protein